MREAVPASGREIERGDLIILTCPVTCGKREWEGRFYSLELVDLLRRKSEFLFCCAQFGCLTRKKKKHIILDCDYGRNPEPLMSLVNSSGLH